MKHACDLYQDWGPLIVQPGMEFGVHSSFELAHPWWTFHDWCSSMAGHRALTCSDRRGGMQGAHLLVAVAVLDDAPGELGEGEGGGEAELEVGPPGLIVAAAQVLPAGAPALLARVRAPRQPLRQGLGAIMGSARCLGPTHASRRTLPQQSHVRRTQLTSIMAGCPLQLRSGRLNVHWVSAAMHALMVCSMHSMC